MLDDADSDESWRSRLAMAALDELDFEDLAGESAARSSERTSDETPSSNRKLKKKVNEICNKNINQPDINEERQNFWVLVTIALPISHAATGYFRACL